MKRNTESRQFYLPSECARLAGVSTDTLRYYERKHLLPTAPRASNRYRRYPPDTVGRVRTIRSALAAGFTVAELAQILRARDHGLAPCHHVRQMAAKKLEAVEMRIKDLQALRRALSTTLATWDRRLSRTPSGARAGLLDSLSTAHQNAVPELSPHLPAGLKQSLNKRTKRMQDSSGHHSRLNSSGPSQHGR